MKILIILLLILGMSVTTGCNPEEQTTTPAPQEQYKDVTASEFKEIIEEQNVFVLDVHIPEQQHILGTDEFIPYNQLTENIDKLPKDKNTKIAVYCRSGSMSKTASTVLSDMGYKDIVNLKSGINEWRGQGYPLEE